MLANGDLVAFVALGLAEIPDLGAQHPLMVVTASMQLADEWLRTHPAALLTLNVEHGLFIDEDGVCTPVAERIKALHEMSEWT